MFRWGLRCPHCREEAVSILKKMVLLPPRQATCAACAKPVAAPLLPLAALDLLLLVPFLWLMTMSGGAEMDSLLESLQALQERFADRHGYYVFLSGLFFAAFVFAWSWTLLIPLTKPPRPLYVPRLKNLPPRLRCRRVATP